MGLLGKVGRWTGNWQVGVRNAAGLVRGIVGTVVGLAGFAIVEGQALVVVLVWTNRVDVVDFVNCRMYMM